jgi:hypothetical protein
LTHAAGDFKSLGTRSPVVSPRIAASWSHGRYEHEHGPNLRIGPVSGRLFYATIGVTDQKGGIMEKQDLIDIAEGLRLIEAGVMKIQGVMRAKNMKSIQEVAAELIPFFKADDDALTETVIEKLESRTIRKNP